MSIRVCINGFGRIGRLAFRAIQERFISVIEVVAVNDLVPADNLAYLYKYDSVHGRVAQDVTGKDDHLFINGQAVRVFAEKDPSRLPLKELGVDFVIEATGRFTSEEEAGKLLQAGAKKVIITAPAKGENIPTFVMGVNEHCYRAEQDRIVSNASCTTNCLAPLMKILLDNFGVEEGLMTTVHAMTASQPTVDGPSKKDWRGGRAASVNVIPASTGAAKAVALCLPELQGKLTGMALRVPTIDVSALDLTVRLTKNTSYQEVCDAVRYAAEGKLKGIVEFCEDEVVSSDFIGARASCIFDAKAGIGLNSHFYKLIAWYDNEMGYSHRVIDLLLYMAKQG